MRKENFGHGYVLDPCCGGKIFYFDKEEAENVVDFIDKRRGTFTYGDRKVTVDPDEVGDFTNLNDTSVCLCEYNLVVFDHCVMAVFWRSNGQTTTFLSRK